MSLVTRPRTQVEWPDWFFGRGLFDWPEAWRGLVETETATLRVEEFAEGDELVVRAEMPGIDPDKDVEITVSDRMLRIRAERRQATKTEDKKGFRSEFRYGSFLRLIPLPTTAAESDVKATYADGILEVRVPTTRDGGETTTVPVTRG